MLHKNNNNAIIRKLSKRIQSSEKTRSVITVSAILLTTFMISVIFSIGISFLQNYQIYQRRIMGTREYISLEKPTKDQYDRIRELNYVKEAGLKLQVGIAGILTEDGQAAEMEMQYYDKNA